MLSKLTYMDTPITYTAEQIEAIGGTTWRSRRGVVRVYLNNWPKLIGFDIERYGTGNIKGAMLDGHEISNGKAGRLLVARVYWEGGTIRTDLAQVANSIGVAVPGAALVETLLAEIARRVTEVG